MQQINSQKTMFSQRFDFDNPATVYDFVKNQINSISNHVNQLNNDPIRIDQETHCKTITSLDNIQKKIDTKIDEFKENAEWKYFTIAFFGETNAGKSTIIETLRIILREEKKLKLQNEYKAIAKKLDIIPEKYNYAQNKIKSINVAISELFQHSININNHFEKLIEEARKKKEQNISTLDTEQKRFEKSYLKKIDVINLEITNLENRIEEIKSKMSIFSKIKYLFYGLSEEQTILDIKKNLVLTEAKLAENNKHMDAKKKSDCVLYNQKIKKIEKTKEQKITDINKKVSHYRYQVQNIQSWVNNFDKNVKMLTDFSDGKIIGDGRSDFTQQSTNYYFDINDFRVSMLDIPGIEGKESLVVREIEKAVQKTHAVFYVTAKDAPPNEGTLERIKKHLSDQTEVWTIYNKQITNPRQLKKELISSKDEEESLNELSIKLKTALGDNYRGTLIIAGLPAFLSQAVCLEPFSLLHKQQIKYLKNMSRDELRNASNLRELEASLKRDIVGNVNDKIRRSNLNKVRELLKESTESITVISNTYSLLEKDIRNKSLIAKSSIDGYFHEFESHLKKENNKHVTKFKSSVINNTYKRIDDKISDNDFKNMFSNEIRNQANVFEKEMKQIVKDSIEELIKNIETTQKEFLRSVDKITKDYGRFAEMNNLEFDLDFNIKSGVDKTALFSTLLGSGAVMWWNPVGWLAITATAAALLISAGKAVINVFNSNYKKQQQKKSVSKNLPNISRKLTQEMNKNIEQLIINIEHDKAEIYKSLEATPKTVNALNKDLKFTSTCLNKLSDELMASKN